MKKSLFALVAACSLAAVSSQATQFWYDPITNLPPGCITTNSPSVNLTVTNFSTWYPHAPGSAFGGTPYDMLIVSNVYTSGAAQTGKRLRVDGTKSEYIMRLFDPVATNTLNSGTVYFSFVASANFVPAAGVGTYFAALNDAGQAGSLNATNGFEFRARVFEIGATNAYPNTNRVSGCYRMGLANAQNDPSRSATALANTLFVPMDLKGNIDYQVVAKYDIGAASCSMWINPSTESDTALWTGATSDFGPITNALAGLLFRQITPGGTMDIRDVAVGTTFADVMTNLLASSVVQIATNFNTSTNFPGTPALLEVFPTSIGGGALTYQWSHISGGVTNTVAGGTSQALVIPQVAVSDAGNYFCTVMNAGGKTAVSTTNFLISVKADAGLGFQTQPISQGGTIGAQLNLSCTFTGSGPYSISWYLNGNQLTDGQPATGNGGDASIVSGATTPTLTIKNLSTFESGDFYVIVSTAASVSPSTIQSTNAHVVVNLPQAVNIAFLRNLENKDSTATTYWQITNTTDLYAISNAVVISYTNTSGVGGYWIQDATGGINLFVSSDANFIPHLGDIVSAVGILSSFNNSLEMAVFEDPSSGSYSPYATAVIVGHTNWLPAPVVFSPYSQTNISGLMETNLEGKAVMLTNVYFTSPGTLTGTGSTTATTTNSHGEPFAVFFPGTQDKDITGRPYPAFAWTVTGFMTQFKSGAYSNTLYEVEVTRWNDIQTNPPPAVTATISLSGNNAVLNWTAVPWQPSVGGAYAYTVLSSGSVTGPYTPLASGLTFSTTNGTYVDTNTASTPKFYKISSP